MIDIQNINYEPTPEEICAFVRNPLIDHFFRTITEEHKALCRPEFSKCSWEPGWNVKFKKSGKSLCTVYPREHYFTVLVVVGKKEKEQVESILPELSPAVRGIYQQTEEGNGQRWLMIDLEDDDAVYQDTLRLIRIRRNAR